MIGKVLNNAGSGQDSWIIDGMGWATANGAKVVSMSLGGDPTDGTDPLSQAVNDLTASTGALFVIAAGNSGPAPGSLTAPGAATAALTVAATDKTDKLAGFSSRGPRQDGALKPDIAAPGVNITAARAAGTTIGPIVDEQYTTISGTSMATPHVAGAAAILAQVHPDWTADQLKPALMSTAKDDGFTVYEQGAGRVDVARAHRQQVFATTSNVDFGRLNPGQQPDPVSKQISYTNLGTAPVTLTLTRSLRQIGGDAVPDGAFTGDDTVTVPAGGTATTTVTLDVKQVGVGRYTGAVVAADTAAGVSLTTAVGLDLQPPRKKLTIRVINREGQPTLNFFPTFMSVRAVDVPDTGSVRMTRIGDNVFQAFVEAGTYSAVGQMRWVDPATSVNNLAYLINPQIEVTGDTDVTLDARAAKPVTMRTPRPTAPYGQVITHLRSRWDGMQLVSVTMGGLSFAQFPILVTPTEKVTKGVFGFNVSRMLANPQITMRVTGKDVFDLQLFHRGYSDRRQRMGGTAIGGPVWMPWPATHARVELVDVGFARPEDLVGKNLKGKLAVMQWGGFDRQPGGTPDGIPESVIWTDWVHGLKEAGAIGYIAVSNPPTDLEKNFAYSTPTTFVLQPTPDSPKDVDLPEVQVSRDQGRELIKRLQQGPVSVDLNVDPNIHYIEQIYPVYDQQVPDSPAVVLKDDQMVAVDANNYSAQPAMLATGAGVFLSGSQGFGGSVDVFSAGPSRRTEYFGPLNARTILNKTRRYSISPADVARRVTGYAKAGKRTERWFALASAPGSVNLGDAFDAQDPNARVAWYFCNVCREGDLFWPFMDLAAWGDGTTGHGYSFSDARLFREDGQEITATPVKAGPFTVHGFQLPPELATYRMTLEQPGQHTSWTFQSAAATADTWMPGGPCLQHIASGATDKCEQEPVIFLGYDLGTALRLDNTVLAGRPHEFTVFAYHARSRGELPDIAGLRLWTSTDDGATWQEALVKRDTGGTFTVQARYPQLSATTGAVSIKAEAWNADGNRIEQVLDRAFPLAAK